MNRQPILDELARIAGGAATALPGVYSGAGRIVAASGASVKVAYSSLRSISDMQVDDFVHVCVADESTLVAAGSDLGRWEHRIRMQLMVSVSRSDMRTATRMLEEFVPAYFTAYNSIGLGGIQTNGGIVSVRGPIGVEPLYPERHALEFIYESAVKDAYLRVA
jgi:hypothetical protein